MTERDGTPRTHAVLAGLFLVGSALMTLAAALLVTAWQRRDVDAYPPETAILVPSRIPWEGLLVAGTVAFPGMVLLCIAGVATAIRLGRAP